jgi:tripartite-type tricarboxylate transporter receptor subunit TctC
MAGELFKMMSGANMVHVPFRGGAQAITALIAGQSKRISVRHQRRFRASKRACAL